MNDAKGPLEDWEGILREGRSESHGDIGEALKEGQQVSVIVRDHVPLLEQRRQ